MISDSPPDRELEWTDAGIQSSKNLITRLERYFYNSRTEVTEDALKIVEKFVYEMEKNILNFSLNKCIANIYTLLNFLEKNKIYLEIMKLAKGLLLVCTQLSQDYHQCYQKNFLILKFLSYHGLR